MAVRGSRAFLASAGDAHSSPAPLVSKLHSSSPSFFGSNVVDSDSESSSHSSDDEKFVVTVEGDAGVSLPSGLIAYPERRSASVSFRKGRVSSSPKSPAVCPSPPFSSSSIHLYKQKGSYYDVNPAPARMPKESESSKRLKRLRSDGVWNVPVLTASASIDDENDIVMAAAAAASVPHDIVLPQPMEVQSLRGSGLSNGSGEHLLRNSLSDQDASDGSARFAKSLKFSKTKSASTVRPKRNDADGDTASCRRKEKSPRLSPTRSSETSDRLSPADSKREGPLGFLRKRKR